jgi:hypothetical protein
VISVSVDKYLDKEEVDGLRRDGDPPVVILTCLLEGAPLEPVQRALARQWFAPVTLPRWLLAGGIALAHHRRQQRIRAQLLVIIQILVAQGQAIEPLAQQLLDRVLHLPRLASILEAPGKPFHQASSPIDLPQQHHTTIRADPTAVELGHDLAPTRPLKQIPLTATVCLQRLLLSCSLSVSG